jgi:hypothetical protein
MLAAPPGVPSCGGQGGATTGAWRCDSRAPIGRLAFPGTAAARDAPGRVRLRLLLRLSLLGLLGLLLKWIAWGGRWVLLIGVVAAWGVTEWAGGALA